MNKPNLLSQARFGASSAASSSECNAQSPCAACESENAVWIEDPAGELRPLSATVKVRLLWLLRQ